MNSIKCEHCGLINFAAALTCKRCQRELSNFDLATSGAMHNQPTEFDRTPALGERYSTEAHADLADGYRSRMIAGLLWTGGGVLVTYLTINYSSFGVIAWGAILYGIIDFIIGCGGWLAHRRAQN